MTAMKASDFKIINGTPEFVDAVNRAFEYYHNMDPRIDGILQMAADKGMEIMFNPPGNQLVANGHDGETAYAGSNGNDIALWNPDEAILVRNGGVITGIQSAADGLLHEIFHSLDPAQLINAGITQGMGMYDNLSEYVAVSLEGAVNAWLGEPVRDNHRGSTVGVGDPTVHAITTEDGALQLVRMGADGKLEYGEQVAIGSPGWKILDSQFQNASPKSDTPIDIPPIDASLDGYHGTDPTGHQHGDGGDTADQPGGDTGGHYGNGGLPGNEHDNDPPGNIGGVPDPGSGGEGSGGAGDGDDPDHMPGEGGEGGDGGYPGNEHDYDPPHAGDDDGPIGSGIDNGPTPDGSGPEGGRNRDVNAANLHTQPKPSGDASMVTHQYSDAEVKAALAYAMSVNFNVDDHQAPAAHAGIAVSFGEVQIIGHAPPGEADATVPTGVAHMPVHHAALVGIAPMPVDWMSFI